MRTGVVVFVVMLAAFVASADPPRRVYLVTSPLPGGLSPESLALRAEFEFQLRDELRRRGATVLERQDERVSAIVLRPRLEILPRGLSLELVGVRSGDKKLLGSISVKAGGATREAQLKALVRHACFEASQFDQSPTDSALLKRARERSAAPGRAPSAP